MTKPRNIIWDRVADYEHEGTAVDPWDNLDIPELAHGGSLRPLERLADDQPNPNTLDDSGSRTAGDMSAIKSAVMPRRSNHSKGRAVFAIEKLSATQACAATSHGTAASHRDTVQIPVNASAVVRAGQRLVSAHTERVGPHNIQITARGQLEVGQIVHLFFELEPGRQVGVNCRFYL